MRYLTPLLVVGILAACAPAADDGPRVAIEQLNEAVGFYPNEAGATWQYLPDSARLDDSRVYHRVEGPTILEGELVTGWRVVGRGIDMRNFRIADEQGVRLVRRTKPGAVMDFDPPIQELPAASELRVGASWGGETTASVLFPEARPENRRAQHTISYRYTVVDRRSARVPAGEFEVFVIDFRSHTLDEDGEVLEELSQTTWFAPHVGEVRTENGFFLVEMNFAPRER